MVDSENDELSQNDDEIDIRGVDFDHNEFGSHQRAFRNLVPIQGRDEIAENRDPDFNLFAERGTGQRGATSQNNSTNILAMNPSYRGVAQILEEDHAENVFRAEPEDFTI